MKTRAILVTLLAAACGGDDGTAVDPAPPPPPTGTIAGRVTVEGAGLQGVLVSLTGASTQSTATGADGAFRFVSVPVGSFAVALSSGVPGDVAFSSTTLQLTLSSAGQEVRADFSGEYVRTSSIAGAVVAVAPDNPRQPLEGVAVRLGGVEERADTTDAAGSYGFAALRAGEYGVTVEDAGEHTFRQPVFRTHLSVGQRIEHDFVGAGPLFVASDSLGPGRVTVPFSGRLEAFGGSGGYAWSLAPGSRLPRGLELVPDGTVRGTPLDAGAAEFDVTVSDSLTNEATGTVFLRVCEGPLGLAEGDYRVFDGETVLPCGVYVQAPEPGAYYRVTLVDTDAEARRTHDVVLSVDGVSGGSAAAAASGERRLSRGVRARVTSSAGSGWQEALEAGRADARAHARIRRREAELFERLMQEGPIDILPHRSHQGSVKGASRPARDGRVPDGAPPEYDFRLGNPFGNDVCHVETTVTASLIAENDHLAVYEYASSAPAGNVQRTIDFYADHGQEVIRRYFGGVSDVNGDGVIAVLIHPDLPGISGYVWGPDLVLSKEDCAASNEMELMHVDASQFEEIDQRDYGIFGTLVHEAKHVSSLYKRAAGRSRRGNGEILHPTWIEEGTAEIASEVSSRLAWQRAGGPGLTARVTGELLGGAVRSDIGTARAEAYGVYFRMARTVWAFSPRPNAVTHQRGRVEGDVYGSGWHFHRFLLDWFGNRGTSAAADEELMRELNDSLTASGLDGIVAVTGRSVEELLTGHAIAMTFAGSEEVAREDAPRFSTYRLSTAPEVFDTPDPPGLYPWPVTTTGEDTRERLAEMAAPLGSAGTRSFSGPLASSGLRFHDFRAHAAGDAAAFHFTIPGSVRVVVARISEPKPPGF